MHRLFLAFLFTASLSSAAQLRQTNAASVYAAWSNGPPAVETFFPIAVWLQKPENAERYKRAGINVYVGLWRGPTSEHLKLLEDAKMYLVCGQGRGLEHKANRTIIGWMHGDEPDNAQSLGNGKGYGPPILPEKIIRDYEMIRNADPSRPVLLNLGQGVAWDNWIGRGVRRNHPEDYPHYVKGCDIASFDIYPAVHDSPEVSGKLEFVAHGVKRLVGWTSGEKVVWNCIECSRIDNPTVKPTVAQIRAEVWMSLIHGSRGLIYFVHQFKPVFKEASLLDDPELLAGVTAINTQIRELAPVLNSPTVTETMMASPFAEDGSIKAMVKRYSGTTYVFTVNMANKPASGSFHLRDLPASATATVLGESRQVSLKEGKLSDDFSPYGVHLYRLGVKKKA